MAVEAPPLDVLQACYADSDDDEVIVEKHDAPLEQAPALGSAPEPQAVQAAAGVTAARAAPAAGPPAEAGDGGAANGEHDNYDYDEDEDYDEEDWSDDDDDGELGAAMEWAESREGHMAKGHAAQAAFHSGAARGPNAGGGAARAGAGGAPGAAGAPLQPRGGGGNLQKLESRFCVRDDPLDGLGGLKLSAAVSNEVRAGAAKVAASRVRAGDKSDRATVEQAIDPRTRMVLFKMLNRGVFREIHGCISTGKEANVYQATGGQGPYPDLAIKVYKTSVLVFKDRDRYVTGDYRFRAGYCRSNPRKMVKVWAEKEMRNLSRLRAAGIRAPAPLLLRMHVLVMEFVGEDGVAAPRLKDANLPLQRMCSAYGELVSILRTLYQKCRLVHADLSEYNILVHKGELVIIDVSQAVDLDHPKALDFLREDALHINDFFRRAGVAVLTTRELFDFVVDASITPETEEAALAALQQMAASRPLARNAEEQVEDAVFAQAFIPRKLEEVAHYERDREALAAGKKVEGLYYQAITGMASDLSGPRLEPMALQQRREKQQQEQQQQGDGAGGSGGGGGGGGKGAEAEAAAAVGDAAGKIKPKSRGKGPSFMAFLPKAEDQGPATAAASSAAVAAAVAAKAAAAARKAAAEAGLGAGAGGAAAGGGEGERQRPARRRQRQPSPADGEAGAGEDGGGGSSGSGSSSGSDSDESSSGSGDESDSGSGSGGEGGERAPRDKDAEKAARKAHKKEIKEANRERRKSKIPKHVKKSHKKKGGKKK